MKKYLLIFIFCINSIFSFAQNYIDEVMNMSPEQRDSAMNNAWTSLDDDKRKSANALAEAFCLMIIDSVMNEGRYMQALDMLDSMETVLNTTTNMPRTPQFYLQRINIYYGFEEWDKVISISNECMKIHKEDASASSAALIYKVQADSYFHIKQYDSALRSYELANAKYKKAEMIDGQAETVCNMGRCYNEKGKTSMAASLFEKGVDLYANYFGVTPSSLANKPLYVTDKYKKTVLNVFAAQLYEMAVFEQDRDNRPASKKYLKMSVNCGSEFAKSEYRRIYGY